MPIRFKSNAEKEWSEFLKKRSEEEYEYFIFSIRLVLYGLSAVFLTLLLLVRLSVALVWYHYILILLSVLIVVFIDKVLKFLSKAIG